MKIGWLAPKTKRNTKKDKTVRLSSLLLGVGSSVCHGQDSGSGVEQFKVFVGETGSVDGLASNAVVVGKVTPLDHEIGNDAVEPRTPVGQVLALVVEEVPSAELLKVSHCSGYHTSVQAHDHPTDRFVVNRNIKVYPRRYLVPLGGQRTITAKMSVLHLYRSSNKQQNNNNNNNNNNGQ